MTELKIYGADGAEAGPAEEKWHQAADVVIVGSGAAGLSAAIEARQAGADVLVLEKMSFVGGNTSISSAAMMSAASQLHAARKIPSWSVDQYYQWTLKGGDYRSDPDILRMFADRAPDAVDFLHRLGAPFPKVTRQGLLITGKWGKGLIALLHGAAAGLGVRIRKRTRVTGVVADPSGTAKRVYGLQTEDEKGQSRLIQAKRAVILASGGFGANADMVQRYAPSLTNVASTNLPGVATGECLSMALSLGAATEGIEHIQIHPTVAVRKGKRGFISEAVRVWGAILVNPDGNRFVDEVHRRDLVARAIRQQKRAFLLFSQNIAYDKTDGYVRRGLAEQADRMEDLAGKIGVDPETLLRTVGRYNGFVEAQDDPDFQRGRYRELGQRQMLPGKIDSPPYYAIEVRPGVHHCCGGLKINPRAQVMADSPGGKAIENLYAAGEVAGGVHGTNRMGGNAITECIVFGRIAGVQAAARGGRRASGE